jgi:hypothetical protein
VPHHTDHGACHNVCHDDAGLAHLRSPSFQVTRPPGTPTSPRSKPRPPHYRFVLSLSCSSACCHPWPVPTDANPPPKFMHACHGQSAAADSSRISSRWSVQHCTCRPASLPSQLSIQ